jgi:hypothetical protein
MKDMGKKHRGKSAKQLTLIEGLKAITRDSLNIKLSTQEARIVKTSLEIDKRPVDLAAINFLI